MADRYYTSNIINKMFISYDAKIKQFIDDNSNNGEPIAIVDNYHNLSSLTDVNFAYCKNDYTDNTDIDNPIVYSKGLYFYDGRVWSTIVTTSNNIDEKVKLLSTDTESKYLGELLDNITISTDTGKVVIKTLDGLDTSIEELNYIKGLDGNIMTKLSAIFSGINVYTERSFDTYADLLAFDFTTLPQNNSWLMYVVNDENHNNRCVLYLCNHETNTIDKLPIIICYYSSEFRDFTQNKIDLTTEVTGKLPAENIDTSNLVVKDDLDNFIDSNDIIAGDGIEITNSMTGDIIIGLSDSVQSTTINDVILTGSLTGKELKLLDFNIYGSSINDESVKKADKIHGVDSAQPLMYYGKNNLGEIGFHYLPINDGESSGKMEQITIKNAISENTYKQDA